MLLTDIEASKLPEPLTRRLFYVGTSRANVYLESAICDDIARDGYGTICQSFSGSPAGTGRKDLLSCLGMTSLQEG